MLKIWKILPRALLGSYHCTKSVTKTSQERVKRLKCPSVSELVKDIHQDRHKIRKCSDKNTHNPDVLVWYVVLGSKRGQEELIRSMFSRWGAFL